MLAHQAQPQPFERLADAGRILWHRSVDRSRIERVVTGQDFQQQGGVFGGAGERPDLIQAAGEGDQPESAHAAVSGFEPSHAAQSGRLSDRAAGVGAHGQRRHRGGHRGGRSAAGTAGNALEIPGVAGQLKGRIFVRAAHGELVHVGLADQDRVGRLESGDDGRVVGRAEVLQHPRGAGRRLTLGAKQIFDGHRQPAQTPHRLALLAAAVDLGGAIESPLGIDAQEGLHPFIVILDAVEKRPGHLHGSGLARLQPAEQLQGG